MQENQEQPAQALPEGVEEMPQTEIQPITKLTPEQEALLIPVFVGCENAAIIRSISKHLLLGTDPDLDVDDENYTIVVMSPEVLEASTKTWFMSRLSVENQTAVVELQEDKKAREDARKAAQECDDTLRKWMRIAPPEEVGGYKQPIQFKHYELKNAMMLNGKNFSHKQIRELIDFMSLHNFLQPTDIKANYNKQQWEFTFDDSDLLMNIDWLEEQLTLEAKRIEDQLQMLQNNRKTVQANIEHGIVADDDDILSVGDEIINNMEIEPVDGDVDQIPLESKETTKRPVKRKTPKLKEKDDNTKLQSKVSKPAKAKQPKSDSVG